MFELRLFKRDPNIDDFFGEKSFKFKYRVELERIAIEFKVGARTMNRPIARNFTRGVTWGVDVFVCMHEHTRLRGYRGMLPQEMF